MSGQQALKRGAGTSSDEMSEHDLPQPQSRTRESASRKRKTPRMDTTVRHAQESQTEKDSTPRKDSQDDASLRTIQQPRVNNGRGRVSAEVAQDESEDDSQPVVSKTRRRTSRQAAESQSQARRQAQDDLEAELADLDTDSESQPETEKPLFSAKIESLNNLQSYRAKRLRRQKGLPSAKPGEPFSQDNEPKYTMTAEEMFDTDTADEDFVEQDSEDDVLAMNEENPLHALRIASMELRDLWRYAMEWMVKKGLELDFENNERFRHAFERLDDKPSGLVKSEFNSSSWKPGFIAMLSRPEMVSEQITSESEICDACNQTRHPATFRVEFVGKPYHPDTLHQVCRDNDIDCDGQDCISSRGCHISGATDHGIDMVRDNGLQPDRYIRYLGSTCMRKAQASHQLQHWRYRIYNIVKFWLNEQRYNTREEVKKRDEMSVADRHKYTLDILERMDGTGISEHTWQVFSDTVDDACASRVSWSGTNY
jgi:hypothetical protein